MTQSRRLLHNLFWLALLQHALVCGAPAPAGKKASAPPPVPPVSELADRIRKAKAEPERLLLLRDFIVHAQSLPAPAEKNPYFKVLSECLAEKQDTALRIAVVRAVTVPVAGRKPYLAGVKLILDYLGSDPPVFRKAVREGLLLVAPGAPERFPAELEKRELDLSASRSQIEDAAFLLWAVDPRRTVESLLKGLKSRSAKNADTAPFLWILADYVHHRESSLEGWEKYWRENPDPPALRETHFLRRLVQKELLDLWNDASEVFQQAPLTESGLEAYWLFLRRSMDSPWPAVRVKGCRALAALAQKLGSGTPSARVKSLLKRQLGALMELLGQGTQPRYEPLEVRLEALRAVGFFQAVAHEEPRLATFLKGILGSKDVETSFRRQALKTVGDLKLGALRETVCRLILEGNGKSKEEVEPHLGFLAEALKTLGKIGIEEPGNQDVAMARGVAAAIKSLYKVTASLGSAEAAAFRQAAVTTLGKVARGPALGEVTAFLREILKENLGKSDGEALASSSICALGEAGAVGGLDDLAAILAKRASYPANLVQDAVVAVWLIGSSGRPEAAAKAIEVFADYLESGDPDFSKEIRQKVLFLCRESIALVARLAGRLAAEKKFKAACDILSEEEIKKVRQVALFEGSVQDLKHFWTVEEVYLEGLETLERFDECAAEISRLKKFFGEQKRGGELEKIAKEELVRLAAREVRVRSKKEINAAIKKGAADAITALLKKTLAKDKDLFFWAVEKVRKSPVAREVLETLLKDAEVPEEVKARLKPTRKTAPAKSASG